MKQGFRKDSGVIKDTLQHPGPRLSRSEWFPGATGLHPHRGWNTSKVSAFSPLAIILFLVWLEYHPSFQRRSSMHENRFPTFGVKSLWPPLSTSFGNRILESKGICVQKAFDVRCQIPLHKSTNLPIYTTAGGILKACSLNPANTRDQLSFEFLPI